MSQQRTRATAVATALLIAAMSLVGCSAGGGTSPSRAASESATPSAEQSEAGDDSGQQTTAEACTALQSSIAGLQEELTSSLGNFQADPAAGAQAVAKLSDTFSGSVSTLENDEVATAAAPADEALSNLADAFQAYATDPASADPQALTKAATDLQNSFTSLQQTCS